MLCFFFLLIGLASAHSWVEQMTVIAANGTFVGDTGYARGNVLRTVAGFNDNLMVNLLPPDGRSGGIESTDAMCKSTQQSMTQTSGSPRLQAEAGAAVALRYQENGHVTLPQNQPGKPANRGTMYVYGTTQPSSNDTLLAIHKVWNANGTGGDQRGVLLSTQSFDDGRCYQINSGNISVARQAEFPHTANEVMGANLWCQQDLALPSDAPSGKPYTLYWVWDWPTAAGVDPSLPDGKAEIYTTCMDVDVVDSSSSSSKQVSSGYVSNQDLNSAAIPTEFENLANTGLSSPDSSSSAETSSAAASTTMSTSTVPAMTAVSSPATTDTGANTVTVTQTGESLIPTVTSTSTGIITDTVVDLTTIYATSIETMYPSSTGLVVRNAPSITTSSYHSPTLSPSATFRLRGRNPMFANP